METRFNRLNQQSSFRSGAPLPAFRLRTCSRKGRRKTLYLAVQKNLYKNWGKAGAILEPTPFSSAVALAILTQTTLPWGVRGKRS